MPLSAFCVGFWSDDNDDYDYPPPPLSHPPPRCSPPPPPPLYFPPPPPPPLPPLERSRNNTLRLLFLVLVLLSAHIERVSGLLYAGFCRTVPAILSLLIIIYKVKYTQCLNNQHPI